MLRRLCFWVLFAVVLLVAWRLAGMLLDLVLLTVIVWVLVVCGLWPFKRKL
ncbi:hypothetical protein ACT5NI_003218 [Klebsiella pneumoniae]